uniref:JmjC domain-containing protein n=1 Tax=Strongyloides stercoralis TaxID=6248 RepID=A0A0K0EFX4_STRER
MNVIWLVVVIIFNSVKAETKNGGWKINGEIAVGIDGPCTIERRDGNTFTQEEFIKDFAYTKPVIVYNINNAQFRKNCEREEIVKNWGDKPVVLNSANTYSYTRKETTFGDYINRLLKAQNIGTLGNETFILFGDIDQRIWKPLLDTYNLPLWSLPNYEPALSFGIAGVGTGVPFHFHGPGFAEVVHGTKRWFLQPFEKRPTFNPDQSTLQWYYTIYPILKDEDKPLECLMKPGEIIYFPDKWWHATLNTETAVFISTFLSPLPKSKVLNNNEKSEL